MARVGSQNNDNFFAMLQKAGVYFENEYPILGGHMRGGYIIDFVLRDAIPDPLAVNLGKDSYFHKDTAEETIEDGEIMAYCKNHGWIYKKLENEETATLADCFKWLKENYGYA